MPFVARSALQATLLPANRSGFDLQPATFALGHDRLLPLAAAFLATFLVAFLVAFLGHVCAALDYQPLVSLCHLKPPLNFAPKENASRRFPSEASLFSQKRIMANLFTNSTITPNSIPVSRGFF